MAIAAISSRGCSAGHRRSSGQGDLRYSVCFHAGGADTASHLHLSFSAWQLPVPRLAASSIVLSFKPCCPSRTRHLSLSLRVRSGSLGEGRYLPALAVLTAHRVAEHGLVIVTMAGRQSFFDFANLGDDGVTYEGQSVASSRQSVGSTAGGGRPTRFVRVFGVFRGFVSLGCGRWP